jgi:hypothetical protein
MAVKIFRCSQVNHFWLHWQKVVPAARMRSATSSGGRAIYFAASESASRGLAVAPMWRFDRWM